MDKKELPFIVKVHNATCPVWILKLGFLKKIEPGCQIASNYIEDTE
ncbi:MAG: hypothetical protein MK384_08185 [SAR202 cluster bacterium]|jgi:hypothetical protein|nr:hypothetical protein [SAR202 cluster bacterium]|tara:strand:+ start:201 stop:338 length:138 start_codon:yes stop_codon:yes gene_type:complete